MLEESTVRSPRWQGLVSKKALHPFHPLASVKYWNQTFGPAGESPSSNYNHHGSGLNSHEASGVSRSQRTDTQSFQGKSIGNCQGFSTRQYMAPVSCPLILGNPHYVLSS